MLFTTKSKFRIEKSLFRHEISNPVSIGYINRGVQQTGCYMILIKSSEDGGPNGIYSLSRSNKTMNGSVAKLACSNGISGDSIDIEWQPECLPHVILQYCNNDSKSESIKFKFKIKVICC